MSISASAIILITVRIADLPISDRSKRMIFTVRSGSILKVQMMELVLLNNVNEIIQL